MSGRDVRTWCQAQGGVEKVPVEVRLEVVAQAAEGLAAAHAAGIIHRDIKPGNILVRGSRRREEAEGRCRGNEADLSLPHPARHLGGYLVEEKLTDFGIGQVVSSEFLAGVTATGFTRTLAATSSSSRSGTQM